MSDDRPYLPDPRLGSMNDSLYMPPPPIPIHGNSRRPQISGLMGGIPDPFTERRPRICASEDLDIPMHDCSKSACAIGRPLGYDSKDRNFVALPHEAVALDDLVMSSPKQPSIGVSAPANTRNSSATNSPQLPSAMPYSTDARHQVDNQDRLSAPMAGHKRTPESRSIGLTCRDSDIAMSSHSPRTASQTLGKESDDHVRAMCPPCEVKCRKEAKDADFRVSTDGQANGDSGISRAGQGAAEKPSAATRTKSGDGKRKRTPNTYASKKGTATDPLSLSSPRKASKRADLQESSDDNDPDGFHISNSRARRPPLASLDNILQ